MFRGPVEASRQAKSDVRPSSALPHISQRARWAHGQPISFLMHKALAHPELISLAAGFVDQQTLPVAALEAAVLRLTAAPARARAALQYGTTAGYLPLRQAMLEQWVAADGYPDTETNLSVDQIVVTAGSNQMLHLLADTLFDTGDIVLCASPSYFVYLGLLRNLGVRAVGVPTDEHGLIPAELQRTLQGLDAAGELSRVRAIYVVSYFDNPASTTLPVDRRQAIVDLARHWSRGQRIHVIEDAAYRELRYTDDDVPSLRAFDPDGQTVIVTQTYSKSFSPGLRLGWALLPPDLVEPVCNQKGNHDFGSPNFNQHVMAEVLAAGEFEPHVAALRAAYRLKLDAMLRAADQYLAPIPGVRYHRPGGGLYLWLRLPAGVDAGPEGRLFERALAEGMLYVPGQYCYSPEGEPAAHNTIRLTFGVQPVERIEEGVAALARALEATLDEA